jgi:hypothetical protein
MVGRGGLEPPTSRLSGVRSNHLSYRPKTDRQACDLLLLKRYEDGLADVA